MMERFRDKVVIVTGEAGGLVWQQVNHLPKKAQ